MTSIRRALVVSLLERYALIALQLVSYVLIARLLTPEEIGIYSVSLALIGIAQVVREFGIGSYLVQEKELTEAKIRTAFGVTLVIGSGLFLLLALGAPMAGWFYEDERMTTIVRVISLNFLILPFCSISMSLLRRNMEFSRLLYVNLVAALTGFFITIGLAWHGFGPQSLAWGAVAANIATGLGAWLARRDRTILLPSFSEWRAIASFGGQSSLTGVVTSVAMDINDLVVGKVLGFAPVALLSRAQGLMNLFHRDLMGAVRNVAFPAFALAHREGEAVEPKFIATVTNVTAFAWPFYGFIAIFPLEIIRLMFGPQWDAAAPLVPVFALAGALAATFSLIPNVILAIGRIDLLMRAEIAVQTFRVAVIVGAVIVFETMMSAALAYLVAFSVALPVFFWVKNLCIANDWPRLLRGLGRSLVVTAGSLSAAVSFALWNELARDEPIGPFVLAMVCIATAYLWMVSVSLTKHPLAAEALFQRAAACLLPVFFRRS
jgi:O-antigen/teichoic acid export membrane protein